MYASLGSLLAVAVPQLVASGWLFHLLYRRVSRGAGGILATLVGALIVIVAVEETLLRDFGGPGRGTVLGFATIITALAGLSAAHAAVRHIRTNALLKQREIAGIVTFLLIVPFIGALGSNLPTLAAANQYMVFWTGAIAAVLLLLPWPDWAKHLIPVFWALPTVLVTAVVIEALIIYPYGLTTSLFAQTDHLATAGPLAGLRVDHATARFVREARLLASTDGDDRPDRPIVAAYDLPGLVYMLGGVSPGAPWFFGDEPEQRLNCVELRTTRLHDLSRSVIITNPGVYPQFAQCLHAVGIAFPSGYHRAGLVKDPYNGHTIAIYVPRR
jgi:hypothetical protein